MRWRFALSSNVSLCAAAARLVRDSRLGHNVIVLSSVSFFQDAASEMLYPIIPIFLTSVLGASPVRGKWRSV